MWARNGAIVRRAEGIKSKWSQPCLYDCTRPVFLLFMLFYFCLASGLYTAWYATVLSCVNLISLVVRNSWLNIISKTSLCILQALLGYGLEASAADQNITHRFYVNPNNALRARNLRLFQYCEVSRVGVSSVKGAWCSSNFH